MCELQKVYDHNGYDLKKTLIEHRASSKKPLSARTLQITRSDKVTLALFDPIIKLQK